MSPDDFAKTLRAEPDESTRLRKLVEYFADSYQWTNMRDGSISWGWFTRHPRELARLALDPTHGVDDAQRGHDGP